MNTHSSYGYYPIDNVGKSLGLDSTGFVQKFGKPTFSRGISVWPKISRTAIVRRLQTEAATVASLLI